MFILAAQFSKDYRGGMWMAPKKVRIWLMYASEWEYAVEVDTNYYKGTMNAKTYGAALLILRINQLSWKAAEEGNTPHAEALADLYFGALSAAIDHPDIDAAAIYGFLD